MRSNGDMVTCYVARRAGGNGAHELLQLRRAPGEFMAGAWSPVRGRIEGNETAYAAALRELKEETGLTPVEFYQVDTIDQFYLAHNDCIYQCPGFCAIVEGAATVVLNQEHDGWRWIERGEIDRAFLWPGERAQLAEVCREILDVGPAKEFLRIKT